jgi:thioredoxin reductase
MLLSFRLLKRFVSDNYLNHLDKKDEYEVLKDKENVAVIGGDNAAFDAACSVRRLGGAVTLVARECEDKSSRDGIPADLEEIRGAWE